jgi:hypothetical protein
MRRSNRGDHGLTNPVFGETMQLRIMDDSKVRKLMVNTGRLETCANIKRT